LNLKSMNTKLLN